MIFERLGVMWHAIAVLFIVATVHGGAFPVVETNFGTIRGKWLSSARNLSVAAYLGIRYAEPPVGDLRFQSPKPWTNKWTGIQDATTDGSMCVQLDDYGNTVGEEDCLYLNVFVPLIPSGRKLPVLVFVHGGGFNVGSNNSTYLAPDYLMDHQIILVTVNYRLGIFGFLSTATEQVPGNAGLKDILEALKWIQNNIMHFGGDPNSVTLSGQSAGAAAVHHLALSPRTEGLFDKFITHSGSAVAPWAIHPPFFMRMKYLIVARDHGCTTDSNVEKFENYLLTEFGGDHDEIMYKEAMEEDAEILNCFRQMSPSRLVNAMNLFHVWKQNPWCNFGPTVEVRSDDAIITKHPLKTIQHGEFRDIPWINGLVRDEGLLKTIELFRNGELMSGFLENIDNFGVFFLEWEEAVTNTTVFIEALKENYLPEGFGSSEGLDINRNLTQMAGDALITWPSYQAMNYQVELMNSSVYFYLFAYEGTFSRTYLDNIPKRYGVAHTDDLNYLFPCLNRLYAGLQLHNTVNDWTMVNIMTELWTAFVKDGEPSAVRTPQWEPYNMEHQRYMRIGSGRLPDIKMEKDFLPLRMGFWEDLVANVSQPLYKLFLEDNEEEPGELGMDPNFAAIVSSSIFITIQVPLLVFIVSTLF